MELQRRLDILINLAADLGLTVRREVLGGEGGGFCRVKGRPVLFVDVLADVETQYERTLAALAPMKEIDQRFLPPEVREDIDRQRTA